MKTCFGISEWNMFVGDEATINAIITTEVTNHNQIIFMTSTQAADLNSKRHHKPNTNKQTKMCVRFV